MKGIINYHYISAEDLYNGTQEVCFVANIEIEEGLKPSSYEWLVPKNIKKYSSLREEYFYWYEILPDRITESNSSIGCTITDKDGIVSTIYLEEVETPVLFSATSLEENKKLERAKTTSWLVTEVMPTNPPIQAPPNNYVWEIISPNGNSLAYYYSYQTITYPADWSVYLAAHLKDNYYVWLIKVPPSAPLGKNYTARFYNSYVDYSGSGLEEVIDGQVKFDVIEKITVNPLDFCWLPPKAEIIEESIKGTELRIKVPSNLPRSYSLSLEYKIDLPSSTFKIYVSGITTEVDSVRVVGLHKNAKYYFRWVTE